MVYAGAFRFFFTRDGKGGFKDFEVISVDQSTHDQTTGERQPKNRTPKTIKGALDPVTERDLQNHQVLQEEEGDYKFFTEFSHGLENGDEIRGPGGREFRIVQELHTSRVVQERMRNDADPAGYQVKLTNVPGE